MIIDFHSPANTNQFGYGRAYLGLRYELEKAVAEKGCHRLAEFYTGGDVQIYCGGLYSDLEEHFERKSQLLLAYTMYEATILHPDFKRNMHKFDGLIVPSDWCKKVFEDNGYKGPIFVVPLGVNPDDWPLLDRPVDRKPFRILWQGAVINDRKGGPLVLKVFNDLNLPDSELWLKFNPHYTISRIEWDLWLDKQCLEQILVYPYQVKKINDIRVRSCGRAFKQKELRRFLSHADLSIYPSFGEGFGLIPLEHMATGLPVILADNSGMSMYANPEYCWPISCKAKCSSFGQEHGVDYLADEDEIKRAILWAYENRVDMRALGERASAWVRENWTYEKAARKLIETLEGAIEIKERAVA
jgi:glycosyltransferase involved in cell wall biosynthesis